MHGKSGKPESIESLQREWDKRLADSGFDDLERRKDGGRLHPHMALPRNRPDNIERKSELADYYHEARALLHKRWTNPRHREIWRLHCEGLSWDDIVATLPRTSKHTVQDVIDRHRALILKTRKGSQGESRGVHRIGVGRCLKPRRMAKDWIATILATVEMPKPPTGRIPKALYPAVSRSSTGNSSTSKAAAKS